jgi:hypothetical protein
MELNTGVKKLVGNREVLEEMNDKASLMKGISLIMQTTPRISRGTRVRCRR